MFYTILVYKKSNVRHQIYPCTKKEVPKTKFWIIYIRVTQDRKSKYFSTGETLSEDLWNKNQKEIRNIKTKITDEERDTINIVINQHLCDVKKHYSEISNSEVKPKEFGNKKSFITILLSEIDDIEKNVRIGTSKKY